MFFKNKEFTENDLRLSAQNYYINTTEAINLGVKWVDCTITGMGRGPGNAKTENFLVDKGK